MKVQKKKNFTRDDLTKLFAQKGFTKGAEVGVRNGRYSKKLCQENDKLHLLSVDAYDLVYAEQRTIGTGIKKHKQNYKRAKRLLSPYNCDLIVKTSLDAVREIPYESLDFVYIDGSHEFDYVICDIIEWGKRVKKGGIISGHDYHKGEHIEVYDAVNIYCKMHSVRKIYITDEKMPSWWFKRTW